MITIPFANRLSSVGGPQSDGVIYGSLTRVVPVTALSQVALAGSTRVLRGNSDTNGAITWSDITTSANNDTAGDVSVFDLANPTNDMLCFELAPGDEVSGIALLVSTAASLTGVPVAEVRYRTATSGWATAAGVVTPPLTSTGLKVVTFSPVKFADVSPTDDLLDPFTLPQVKCLFLRFTGITAVTTAPLFSRAWKRRATSVAIKATNFTGMVNQGTNPDFADYQNKIIPVTDDVTVFGWDEIPTRLNVTLYRPAASGLGARKLVYSKADAWADLPSTSVVDSSSMFSALLIGLVSARSVSFNGTTHDVTTSTAPIITGAFSISVWAYATGTNSGNNTLVDLGSYTANTGFGVYLNGSNRVSLRIRQDFDHYVGPTLPTNEWMHVVITYDGVNTARYYTNGTLFATETTRTTLPTAAATVRFGRREAASTERFIGRIDECQIYNTALSATTITLLWNGGKGVQGSGTELGIVAAWHFDETIGSTSASFIGSFDGVVTGATVGAAAKLDWDAPAGVHSVVVIPPSDWAKLSMTDVSDVAHNRYWLGWKYTADTAAPVLPFNATITGQLLKATGNVGISSPEETTYTQATIVCRDTSTQPSSLLLVNATQGKATSVSVPANSVIVTAVISLPVVKGDAIVVTNPAGDVLTGIGDGAIFLS